jgi:hypothetical protein
LAGVGEADGADEILDGAGEIAEGVEIQAVDVVGIIFEEIGGQSSPTTTAWREWESAAARSF